MQTTVTKPLLTMSTRVPAPQPVVEPRESATDKLPGPPRDVTICRHAAPNKPCGVNRANLARELAQFCLEIQGHLIAHGASTPLRDKTGRVIRSMCVWLGYPTAHGPPSYGGSRRHVNRIRYVAMLVGRLYARTNAGTQRTSKEAENKKAYLRRLLCRTWTQMCSTSLMPCR